MAVDIGSIGFDIPYVCTSYTDEWNHTYRAVSVNPTERIAHIPHEIEIQIGIFSLAVAFVIPVHGAVIAAETEADVG